MKRASTKTFIIDFETGLNKKDRDICEKKLRIAKSIYNACLNEAMRRINKYRSDAEYQATLDQYREIKKEYVEEKDKVRKAELNDQRKVLGNHLNEIKKMYGWWGEYSLNDFAKKQSAFYRGSIGSTACYDLGMRAFRTAEKYANGEADKVRFVGKDDDFSFEGARNQTAIYFKNGLLYFDRNTRLQVDTESKAPDPYYQEALQNRIKNCRLTRKTIRGKKRYYLQLLMEGVPPQTNRKYGEGKISILDVKISHLQMTDENGEIKELELAPDCALNEIRLAELNRKMDSSRRATNPDNYNEDGTIKDRKNRKPWVKSNRYIKLQNQRKELYRKNKETRKLAHEKLSNEILATGTDITIQKLSYKQLQKRKEKTEINESTGMPKSKAMAGKPIARRAPAEFISTLERKAGYIGKELVVDTKVEG